MLGLRDALYAAMLFGAVTYVIQSLHNSQEKALHALDVLANTDNLTGLGNRAAFSNLDQEPLVTSGAAVMVLDVDDFKVINDTYGHPAGDATLVHIAQVVREPCGTADLAYRLGGDEMLVIMPGVPVQAARERAAQLRSAIRSQPVIFSRHEPIIVSVSIGVASSVGQPMSDMGEQYHAADLDLYGWKSKRRRRAADSTPGTSQIKA